jgi:hypothetical protein
MKEACPFYSLYRKYYLQYLYYFKFDFSHLNFYFLVHVVSIDVKVLVQNQPRHFDETTQFQPLLNKKIRTLDNHSFVYMLICSPY